MFDILEKYKEQGHFFFQRTDQLSDVCNMPNAGSGVYIIYALERGRVNLVNIGRFSTGKQFDDLTVISWVKRMRLENIEALDIYWHVTPDDADHNLSQNLEAELLSSYRQLYGELPRLNPRA